MPTTEDITKAIRERLTTGDGLDELLDQLSRSVVQMEQRLAAATGPDRDRLRAEASQLHQDIDELTRLGEVRLQRLHADVVALVRKGSLHRLYGLPT
jgi:hypothetical protein